MAEKDLLGKRRARGINDPETICHCQVSLTNNVGALSPDEDDDTGKLFFTSGSDGTTEITVNMLPVLVAIIGFLMG